MRFALAAKKGKGEAGIEVLSKNLLFHFSNIHACYPYCCGEVFFARVLNSLLGLGIILVKKKKRSKRRLKRKSRVRPRFLTERRNWRRGLNS